MGVNSHLLVSVGAKDFFELTNIIRNSIDDEIRKILKAEDKNIFQVEKGRFSFSNIIVNSTSESITVQFTYEKEARDMFIIFNTTSKEYKDVENGIYLWFSLGRWGNDKFIFTELIGKAFKEKGFPVYFEEDDCSKPGFIKL